MSWNDNRKVSIFLIACCFIFSFYGLVTAASSKEANKDEPPASSGTVIVGMNKEQEKVFWKGAERSRLKFEAIRKARKLIKSEQYQEAEAILLDSMKYADQDKIDSAPIRRLLIDVYEKTGNKEKFLEHANWIVEKTQNDQARQEMKDRIAHVERLNPK